MKQVTLISLLLCLCPAACGRPFVPHTPSGFVELNEGSGAYDYRAAHPDGLVTALRVIANEPEGTLAFWSRAVENEVRQGKGYRLIGQTPVTNRQGIAGILLEFGHDEGRTPHLYRVALYLHDDELFLLEQGGTKELVTAHAAELKQAVEGVAFKTGASRAFSYSGD
jgi:hypothetical protein